MVTIKRVCGIARAKGLAPLGVSLAAVLTLGACSQVGGAVGGGIEAVQSALGVQEDEPVRPHPPQRYCYRTLGSVDCFAQPLEAREANRLVGFEGPPPRSTSGTGPLIP